LLQLGADREPVVATVAVGRLFEIDPAKLKPLLDTLLTNANAGLRTLAARALAALATPEAAASLGLLLDDPHRELRVLARESLIQLAGVESLKGPVRRAVMRVLATGGPRGLEQAVMVVGAIRYEPAAGRLLELLDDRYPEVAVPAAWALRRLTVPATADALLKRVQTGIDRFGNPPAVNPSPPAARTHASSRQQLVHLIEALGLMRHRPAAPLFRKFLPVPPPLSGGVHSRNPFWNDDLRSAALWALGHIYAGDPPADLAALFRERLINAITPYKEDDAARAIMAINLGRMNVKDAVPTLRQYYQSEQTTLIVRRACGWALERITGVPQVQVSQAVAVREAGSGGWFLEPVEP
jgi:HEAT repeat protein